MEQSSAESYHSTWMAHWTKRGCGEGANSFNQPSDIFGKKENSNDTSRHQSTCKLEIAMANSCNPTKGIKDIEKGTCKSEIDSKRMALVVSSMRNKDRYDGIAETSKALNSNQDPRSRCDIFDASARGLCSDSQVQFQTNLRQSESQHSSFLSPMEKSGERSKASCFQETKVSALQAENLQKVRNFSGPNLPLKPSKSFEKNSSKKLYNMFNTTGMFQSSFDEVETTRICTTVDSVVGLSGKHSRFSQTTHSFLITKKTDSNLFKGEQAYINSRRGTDFGRQSFSKLNSVPPSFQHGVEEKNVEDVIDFEDPLDRKRKMAIHDSELSAETDIMDFAPNSEKTRGHGVNSSPHVKVIKLGFSTTPGLVSFGGEEDRPGPHKNKLPDMNLEAPTSSADEQTLEYEEPITSRTQSLDKETVLSHAKHVYPLESVTDLHGSLKPEPGGRWLKRLRLNESASYSAGKKGSDCMEKSHHERGNLSLKGFLEGSMALASKNHGKEVMVVDENTTLKTRGESSYIDSAKKDRDALLSKSWIRRWCHHEETPKKNPNAEIGGGEPRNSNLLLEDIKKKQFPSIGAMALMAKTMNCLGSYDVHNKGAVMVWSTKGFLDSTDSNGPKKKNYLFGN